MVTELRYSGGGNNRFGSASLGGGMSSSVITNADVNNLFDDITRVEVINGKIEYRMFWVYNGDSTNYVKTRLINIVVPADTEIAFAVDSLSLPQQLAAEDDTPSGLTFLDSENYLGLQIPLGNYNSSAGIPIWIRRKVLVASQETRTISLVIDAINDNIIIGGNYGTLENVFENIKIKNRSPLFYTDLDYVGESLLS